MATPSIFNQEEMKLSKIACMQDKENMCSFRDAKSLNSLEVEHVQSFLFWSVAL